MTKKKSSRSNKPEAFKQRVRNMSAQGKSERKIANATGISRESVHKILNEPEAKQALEQAKLRVLVLTEKALDVYLSKMEQGDVRIATRILLAAGVIPKNIIPELQDSNSLESRQSFVQMIMQQEAAKLSQSTPAQNENGQLALDLLAQMSATAKRHEIDVTPFKSHNGNGNGNGHKKVKSEQEVLK